MIQTYKSVQWVGLLAIGSMLLAALIVSQSVGAINAIPNPDPKPGSFGIEATKTQAPPTRGASISTPGNGASFGSSPITVRGICLTDLLVEVYDNGVMVGSVICKNGSFTLSVSLFAGKNELTALVYDDIGQAGPKSNVVTVTYNDSKLTAFGQLITLTSSYGRRSAAVNTELIWPLQLSGGNGPYAFNIDWGDGTPSDLKSQALAGVVSIKHVYKRAGIYQVNIRVTDANGVSAFLQTIAVSNGKVDASAAAATDGENTKSSTKVVWIPAAVTMLLLLPTFWLGRQSQLVSIRNKMLRDRDQYSEK